MKTITKLICGLWCLNAFALPKGFVYLNDIAPTIIEDMRYSKNNNFVGRPIKGYMKAHCVLTKQAAIALKQVQSRLERKGLGLKVYDCYRPTQAVKDFILWSKNSDTLMKQAFYPREKKQYLFKRGYIAAYSGHSRGSTVDLTITNHNKASILGELEACYKKNRVRDNTVDMGTNFDCLDTASHYGATNITKEAKVNRRFLQRIMWHAGFKPYAKEWWHFSLRNEPFPKKYFNFAISKQT